MCCAPYAPGALPALPALLTVAPWRSVQPHLAGGRAMALLLRRAALRSNVFARGMSTSLEIALACVDFGENPRHSSWSA